MTENADALEKLKVLLNMYDRVYGNNKNGEDGETYILGLDHSDREFIEDSILWWENFGPTKNIMELANILFKHLKFDGAE